MGLLLVLTFSNKIRINTLIFEYNSYVLDPAIQLHNSILR